VNQNLVVVGREAMRDEKGRESRSLVIFDNDGVLVDSELLANTVLVHLLERFGLSLSLKESMRRYLGSSLESVRRSVEAELGRKLPEDFNEIYHSELLSEFDAHLQPMEGVVEVLSYLDSCAISYCVASSGDHIRIRRALEITGLYQSFEGRIFSAQDVSRGKPAPDLFLYASESMGALPGDCLVIEDSPKGVRAARVAGMSVVGFAQRTRDSELHEADVILSSYRELLKLLQDRYADSPRRAVEGDNDNASADGGKCDLS
jgi:HAD superfamily hydrolase (TIGR01509 family)